MRNHRLPPVWPLTPESYTAGPPLATNLKTEVAIVGAGIAGLTVAYCLAKSGKKVVVLEKDSVAGGETGRSSAHLSAAVDNRYYYLAEKIGLEKTKLVADSHQKAISLIEQICREEHIDCGFERVPGYLFLHPSDKPIHLEMELKAARMAGLEVQEGHKTPGFEVGRHIRFSDQAIFDPVSYANGLAKAIEKWGGSIYTNTRVSAFETHTLTVENGFEIEAEQIVVATNSPINNLVVMHLSQTGYQTYVIAATIKKGLLPNALWWDTGDFTKSDRTPPYHYIRIARWNDQEDLVICGGEDHPTGHTNPENPDPFENLETWLRTLVPIDQVMYRWSGEVMEPSDGLAFIGRNKFDNQDVYIVTGDSGHGLTHGTMAGILIRDLILGNPNPFEVLYAPARYNPLSTLKPLIQDITSGILKDLTTKPVTPGFAAIPDIKRGEALIVEKDGRKYGAYRDDQNMIHLVDAACTHLGCTVAFNPIEKSWDCPCHASRFSCTGKVLHGPANQDLAYENRSWPLEKQ